ncbi:adhesion G protein-coupled receptor E5 isoform 2-T2 [Clarias gariepinus]
MSHLFLLFLGLLFAVLKDMTAEGCDKGYITDNDLCVDENECDPETAPICGANANCYNTNGSYYCQCITGYQTRTRILNFTQENSEQCKDINECTTNIVICGSNAACDNTPGSYYCTCVSGFVASNGQKQFNASQSVSCNDINECEKNNCGVNSQCKNTLGSYYCTCKPGFVSSNGQEKFKAIQGVTCNDINECEENKTICGSNAICNNTIGSYYCTCNTGFVASHLQGKFNASQDVKCNDINECEENKTICGFNATCNNTIGSYYCTCNRGFVASHLQGKFNASQDVKCNDINECEKNKTICGSNATCNNTIGSYYCTCNTSFVASHLQGKFNASQDVKCNDINECEENKTICGSNAICNNTIGSYYCTCNTGFVASHLQGKFNASQDVKCNDINECEKNETICGSNATCNNTIGSYYCTCNRGFVASHLQGKFNASQDVKCNELKCDDLYSENPSVQISEDLNQLLLELQSKCKEKETTGERMLEILLEALDRFLSKTSLTDTKIITALFKLVENILPLIGQLQTKSDISKSYLRARVQILVKRSPNAPHGMFSLSTNDTEFNSHWEAAVGDSYQGFASTSLFEYRSLNSSLINTFSNRSKISVDRCKLNSKVVTIAVTNPNTAHLKNPITLNFSHLQETQLKSVCVFWDSKLEGGAWSTEGCNVIQNTTNYSVCSCTHLSSFAVLMALHELDDVFELQLITWIGLSLSLICLFICILTFWLIRSIQSTRTTIHLHLCISLFIADLIFLVGINQTGNKVGCSVVAGLLHFFFLAVFCWMCLEGVQLFRMVVLVFNTTLKRVYLMAAGYGIPALIVIISAGINYEGYGTPRYCWLNLEKGFIWSFFGPVCVIIVVNAVFFLITVSKLAEKFNSLNPDLNSLKKIKTFTITAVAQLCVLGTMWIFGCFQFDNETLVMSYIFTVLNSLQGVLVFIMHCLLSKQVRDEYIRFLTCVTTLQKMSYSEFSTNQSSKSQLSKSVNDRKESRI